MRLLPDRGLGTLRQQHPDGNLQSPPGWINDTDRPISPLRSAKDLQGRTTKRMKRVEDLNIGMIRGQGIVGVGSSSDRTMGTVGDVGYVDGDGYLYLTDRAAFMIISGGVNIYPQEGENLLITHPKIADAAVFGVPNADLGEEVKAVVQLMPDVRPNDELAEELIAFCREHLAHMKCPRSIDFAAELPRLPTGKLYKRELRDRYWAGHRSRIV